MTLQSSTFPGDSPTPASHVLLVGLDGATWRLLDPLMKEGRLPCLAELVSQGAKGGLESTIPPVTASAWSSLYTGRSPGRHGVYDFRRRMGTDSTHRPWVTLGSVGGPKMWDIAATRDKRAGLVNLPLTFPPVPVKGYVIGGMPVPPTRDEIGLPGGLVDEIVRETGGYISDVDLLRGESPDVTDPEKCFEFVEQVGRAVDSRGKAMQYLMEKYPVDLTACVLVAPDRLSHLFWQVLMPENDASPLKRWEQELRERMFEVLGRMDRVVGELAGRMNPDDLVVVVSDHGFGRLDGMLKLNRLLRDLGYLKFRAEAEGGLRRKIAWMLPEPVRRFLRSALGLERRRKAAGGERKPFDPYSVIDWSGTRAYSGGSVEQGVFINVQGREPWGIVGMGGEYHKVRDELIVKLRKVLHPGDGNPLFDWVEPRENVYSGEYLGQAPDIIFQLRGHSMVVAEDIEPPMVGKWTQPRAGFHRREGILVMKGPMVKPGIELEGSRIQDVAPTILTCWGIPCDEGMDGRVLSDALDPAFLEAHPERRESFVEEKRHAEPCDDDADEMEDLLKGLGYLN